MQLPQTLRGELERRIVKRAFGGYQELANWLQAQRYQISNDSVQRYGAKLHQKLDAMELAVHLASAIAQTGSAASRSLVPPSSSVSSSARAAYMHGAHLRRVTIVRSYGPRRYPRDTADHRAKSRREPTNGTWPAGLPTPLPALSRKSPQLFSARQGPRAIAFGPSSQQLRGGLI